MKLNALVCLHQVHDVNLSAVKFPQAVTLNSQTHFFHHWDCHFYLVRSSSCITTTAPQHKHNSTTTMRSTTTGPAKQNSSITIAHQATTTTIPQPHHSPTTPAAPKQCLPANHGKEASVPRCSREFDLGAANWGLPRMGPDNRRYTGVFSVIRETATRPPVHHCVRKERKHGP